MWWTALLRWSREEAELVDVEAPTRKRAEAEAARMVSDPMLYRPGGRVTRVVPRRDDLFIESWR